MASATETKANVRESSKPVEYTDAEKMESGELSLPLAAVRAMNADQKKSRKAKVVFSRIIPVILNAKNAAGKVLTNAAGEVSKGVVKAYVKASKEGKKEGQAVTMIGAADIFDGQEAKLDEAEAKAIATIQSAFADFRFLLANGGDRIGKIGGEAFANSTIRNAVASAATGGIGKTATALQLGQIALNMLASGEE